MSNYSWDFSFRDVLLDSWHVIICRHWPGDSLLLFGRFGYFGRDESRVIKLLFCSVSGCLTDGQIYMSVSGEELVSTNTQDLSAVHLLQSENVEVRLTCSCVASQHRPLFLLYAHRFGSACQVILISSSNDPVSEVLSEKLAERAGCVLRYRVQNKQAEAESLMKERGLQWGDVAFFGETPNNSKHSWTFFRKNVSFTVLKSAPGSCLLCPQVRICRMWSVYPRLALVGFLQELLLPRSSPLNTPARTAQATERCTSLLLTFSSWRRKPFRPQIMTTSIGKIFRGNRMWVLPCCLEMHLNSGVFPKSFLFLVWFDWWFGVLQGWALVIEKNEIWAVIMQLNMWVFNKCWKLAVGCWIFRIQSPGDSVRTMTQTLNPSRDVLMRSSCPRAERTPQYI